MTRWFRSAASRSSRPILVLPLVLLAACAAGDVQPGDEVRVRAIEPGAVYAGTGGQFSDLHDIDSLGLKTVLDLDREYVVPTVGKVPRDWEIARGRGMRFVHLPLDPTEPPSFAELDWAVKILGDRSMHPILVHADRDQHRTRAVIAAYRIRAQGWTPERALQEMMPDSTDGVPYGSWRRQVLQYAAATETAGKPDPDIP